MRNQVIHIIIAIALTSCSADEIETSLVTESCQAIGFVGIDTAESRGEVTSLENLDIFAVSATVNNGKEESTYFAHESYRFVKEGAEIGQTTSGQVHYWLDKDYQYNFYAYSPIDVLTFTADNLTSAEFEVDADVAKQKDLIVCTVKNATYGHTVPLAFNHPLSQITISEGATMAQATIKSIVLSGVIGKGVYDFTTDTWNTEKADTTTYVFDCDVASKPNASITGQYYNFFFIPQEFVNGATLTITYSDKNGASHSFYQNLSGQWLPGKQYNYTISIAPKVAIALNRTTIDAHYYIAKATVKAPDLHPDSEWWVEASASDGSPVTVQWASNVNKFVLQGFWTDKYVVDGVATSSARGEAQTAKVTGPQESDIYIFVPENTSSTKRLISVVARSTDYIFSKQTFTQVCPAWVGTYGWEQIEESPSSNFGFDWTRTTAFVMPYSVSEYGLMSDFDNADATTLIKEVETLGNGAKATEVKQYSRHYIDNIGWIWYYYLDLDYSLANQLSQGSATNGLSNTLYLDTEGGTLATGTYELAIQSTYINGSDSIKVFSLPSSSDMYEVNIPLTAGTDNRGQNALSSVLKKNKYNYQITHIDDKNAVVEMPTLSKADLVWYMPAVQQFRLPPYNSIQKVNSSLCWSSTVVAGTKYAMRGNGYSALRSSLASVRAVRSKP